MPVTLEIAGRAVSRLGNAAPNAPVIVRDVTVLASTPTVWSGVTDENGYFVSNLLDDAKVYRADVQYDAANQYKAVRDIASGQMNMLQVRKRLHVQGAASPAVFDGPVTIAGAITLSGLITGPVSISGNLTATGVINAADLQIGGQALDARFVNVGEKATSAATADNSLALGGVAAASYSQTSHAHAYSPDTHAHAGVYAPTAHSHAIYDARVETTAYQGDNTTGGRNVYTTPGGWALVAAIIHEQASPHSIFFCTRPQAGASIASPGTGMYANAGPGGDEVIGSLAHCYITSDGAGLVIGATNAPLAMNFSPNWYSVIAILSQNL